MSEVESELGITIPEKFICDYSKKVMRDPVVLTIAGGFDISLAGKSGSKYRVEGVSAPLTYQCAYDSCFEKEVLKEIYK